MSPDGESFPALWLTHRDPEGRDHSPGIGLTSACPASCPLTGLEVPADPQGEQSSSFSSPGPLSLEGCHLAVSTPPLVSASSKNLF
ncbi:hypothetical protein AAY473_030111 [Plecturocebus cupreus]